MVQYAATSLPGVTPKEKDSGHSDIEWLIDVFTEADRRGDAVAFADVYETSSLKKACDASHARRRRRREGAPAAARQRGEPRGRRHDAKRRGHEAEHDVVHGKRRGGGRFTSC